MSIENPENINELIQHAKNICGEPLVRVNISDMQALHCAKQSIRKFCEYSDNAIDRGWFIHELDDNDIQNGYITVPDYIESVVNFEGILSNTSDISQGLDLGTYAMYNAMHNQMNLMDGYSNKLSMYLSSREISYVNNILRPGLLYKFNRTYSRLSFDADKDSMVAGQCIGYEAIFNIEHLTTRFWADDWLIRFTAAKILTQWGKNLTKYKNIEMPGGLQMNGDDILSNGREEEKELMEELYETVGVMHTVIAYG